MFKYCWIFWIGCNDTSLLKLIERSSLPWSSKSSTSEDYDYSVSEYKRSPRLIFSISISLSLSRSTAVLYLALIAIFSNEPPVICELNSSLLTARFAIGSSCDEVSSEHMSDKRLTSRYLLSTVYCFDTGEGLGFSANKSISLLFLADYIRGC